MNRNLFVLEISAVMLVLFLCVDSFAECPDGKNMVTITRQPGKVIEICVPDDAVDQIGDRSNVVVPVVCPCFTPEDVDSASRVLGGPICQDDNNGDQHKVDLGNFHYPTGMTFSTGAYWNVEYFGICSGSFCKYYDAIVGTPPLGESYQCITLEEFEACRQIVINSEMWAFNCN